MKKMHIQLMHTQLCILNTTHKLQVHNVLILKSMMGLFRVFFYMELAFSLIQKHDLKSHRS